MRTNRGGKGLVGCYYHPYKNVSRLNIVSNAKNGFTLVELIVTTCVLAIIAMLTLPSLLQQLADMESKRIRYNLTSLLAEAKAESYLSRENLLLCLSDAAGRCDKNSNQRLLLFVDHNDNNHYDADVDRLLNEQRLAPRYGTLQLRVSAGRHHAKFFGDTGQPRGHFGHIKYCPNATYNTIKYQISFSQIGIVKFKPDDIHPTECDS